MALQRYFSSTGTATTTCNAGAEDLDQDLTKTSGQTGTSVAGPNNTSFVEVATWDINVSGDSPITGAYSVSLNVTDVSAGQAEGRFRVRVVDDAGCTISASSGYSATFSTTGVKTLTTGSVTWGAGDDRLRISLEVRRIGGHGTKTVTVTHGASSYVDAPWDEPAAGTPQQYTVGQ